MAERRVRRAYSEEQKKQLVEQFNHGKPRSISATTKDGTNV